MERSLYSLGGRLSGLVRRRLWLQVLIGMVAGVGVGVLLGPTSGLVSPYYAAIIGNWVSLPGKLFLVAIQFVVVPLVVASVIRGIAGGEAGGAALRAISARTIAFFIATTAIAAVIGLAAAAIVEPGQFIDGAALQTAMVSAADAPSAAVEPAAMPEAGDIPNLITSLFPRDPLTTFVSGDMLQIVITAAIIGAAMAMLPEQQRRPLLDLLASIQSASMVIVGWVMHFAPFAVFGLLAHITARVGLSALLGTGVYVATVLAGLLALLIVYLATVAIFGRYGVGKFLAAVKDVMLLAFSTSSSAAVMPLSLTTAEQKLGVRSAVARFVVPLGTTINMGGTALYQAVATLFLAQAFAVDIGLTGMALVVVMATGAAIGSPGTPGVGIVILATILNSVGIPPAGIAILLGVDRLLDMCRTAVNVSGDLAACVVIDRTMRRAEAAEETPPEPAVG